MAGLTAVVVLFCFSYTVALFIASRRRRHSPLTAADDLFFVFLVPCLNEELVIRQTLDRLLALPHANFAVLVIDDASDDGTAEIVCLYDPGRVRLVQRFYPDARRGKGGSLNVGLHYLRDCDLLEGRRPEDVIVTVLDADGRLEANALFEVAPKFRDPRVGAVQVGVRMYNASEDLLARLQDVEFVTFTDIFQRGRERLGSVGLGGNGQFARLTALLSLGEAPWSACLTEDLDLGLRLILGGWINSFCPTTWVSQQAVTSPRRLVRQRSRWFQGHLQCWKRLPAVLMAQLPLRTTFDLVHHLLSPALVLLITVPLVAFYGTALALAIAAAGGAHVGFARHVGLFVLSWYLLSFGLAPLIGFVYWLRERTVTLVRAIGLGHLYCLYSYLWIAAGWWAVGRVVRRRRGWAKTARTAQPSASVAA